VEVTAPVRHRDRLAIWIVAIVVTAAGRVGGERHWLSDTMGGAALGVVFVSGTLIALQWLEENEEVKIED
jgi:membrane-associated phospholipid phosphatase